MLPGRIGGAVTKKDFALEVARTLQKAGFQAFWAGGCVRDRLLGIEPKDYDVATNARPEEIRNLFGQRRTRSQGAAFGVITVSGPRGAGVIEVATFRTDGPYSDGRHPDQVTFGSAEMDARRRDFTINGMFLDPVNETLIDYVGGQADLNARVIRAIGDPGHRFGEDKLRMMRAVRFAATLDFRLDPVTLESIRQYAAGISVVSAERIAAELTLMLLDPHRGRAVGLLAETELLVQPAILPELGAIVADADQLNRILDRLERLQAAELPEALAALVWDLSDHELPVRMAARLRLSNQVRDTLAWIVDNADVLAEANTLPWSRTQPLLVDPRVANALRFLEARRETGEPLVEAIAFCRKCLAMPREQLDPPRLLDGRALRTLGLKPGPNFARILDEIRRRQLDGEIASPEEAGEVARSLISQFNEGH
jgi:tRNA nucleotidyltransferase/poly(A) polymerase